MKYLVELLDKEITIYNNYLELAVKKKQALIDNNIDDLDLVTESEKSLSTKILALEAARIEFLREQGYPSNITLDQLLPSLKDNDREDLQSTAQNLREVLVQCRSFSDSNMALLKNSSNYINHMIKVFSTTLGGNAPRPVYSRKGEQAMEAGQIADMQG
jgi:flagellar biosynthesis/type III secretory pathway chaperone